MKRLLLLNILLFITFCSSHGSTTVSGTILSVTGEPMPVSSIDVSATGPTNIFTLPDKVYADKNGSFSVTFEDPGIYTLSVRGVFHKSVRIPVMIYDQDKIELDTIRYQIRGLTRGIAVLPGADEYSTIGSDFEAVIYNTSDTDSVELRFNPNEKQPYARVLPEAPVSWQVSLAAFVHFHNDNDKYWSLPLKRIHSKRLI